MSSRPSIWNRLGNLLRGDDRSSRSEQNIGGATMSSSAVDDPANVASRVLRRNPSKRELAERYNRVLELMDALESHFQKQDERSRELNGAVSDMGEILTQLTEAQKSQDASIQTMAENVAVAANHSGKLSETLSQFPASLNAQAEAVQSLSRHLEISQEAEHRVANSLGELGQAVGSLRGSADSQVRTLERLHEREREQRQTLEALVREQSRRFMLVIAVAAILVVAALATMSVTIWQVLGPR